MPISSLVGVVISVDHKPMFHLLSQLLYNLIAEIVVSYWLALIFQVSHVVSEVDWLKPDENNFINMDW